MFGKDGAGKGALGLGGRVERREQSFLQRGVSLDGRVAADGDLRVEGQAVGELAVSGLLTIGPKADVKGVIGARDIVIHGAVRGIIRSAGRICLARGAKVTAELFCTSLAIEDGVFFEGRSHMGELAPAQPASNPERAPTEHTNGIVGEAAHKPASRTAAAHVPSVAAAVAGIRDVQQRTGRPPAHAISDHEE